MSTDQCKHCTARGDFDACRKTPCGHHHNWAFREAMEQAHMAGQAAAGIDPGYSAARAYFDDKIEQGGESCEDAWEQYCKAHEDELNEAITHVLAIAKVLAGKEGGTCEFTDTDGCRITIKVSKADEQKHRLEEKGGEGERSSND